MNQRTQVTLDLELDRRAKRRASELGVSFAEYIRRLVARDLAGEAPRGDITTIFNLGRSGRSDISERVDEFVGEAVDAEYRRETGN
jgi:hypothetical protein